MDCPSSGGGDPYAARTRATDPHHDRTRSRERGWCVGRASGRANSCRRTRESRLPSRRPVEWRHLRLLCTTAAWFTSDRNRGRACVAAVSVFLRRLQWRLESDAGARLPSCGFGFIAVASNRTHCVVAPIICEPTSRFRATRPPIEAACRSVRIVVRGEIT